MILYIKALALGTAIAGLVSLDDKLWTALGLTILGLIFGVWGLKDYDKGVMTSGHEKSLVAGKAGGHKQAV